MAVYVKVNDAQYEASITGRLNDKDWNNRSSKAITLKMSYSDAVNIFVDDVNWFILQDFEDAVEEIDEETGKVTFNTMTRTESYDNSDYSIAGSITDNRDGTITVKMGKPTAEELLDKTIAESDAMMVNYEYQIALLELGINE